MPRDVAERCAPDDVTAVAATVDRNQALREASGSRTGLRSRQRAHILTPSLRGGRQGGIVTR